MLGVIVFTVKWESREKPVDERTSGKVFICASMTDVPTLLGFMICWPYQINIWLDYQYIAFGNSSPSDSVRRQIEGCAFLWRVVSTALQLVQLNKI